MYQKKGVEGNLPVFSRNILRRTTFPLSWLSGDIADFPTWRRTARAKLRESLLRPPPDAPFAARTVAEEDRGTHLARKVTFNLTGDSRVLAYLLVPHGPGPFPAVVLLHDHGARFDIGKEKVVRPFAEPSKRMASAVEWSRECYGGRFIGDELAARGYACLATDMLNWSDRGGGGYEGQGPLAANLLFMGMSFAGLIAHEDLRAAEFLATLPEVQPDRIAAMGLSVGAYRTWQLAALTDRVAVGAAICWMTSLKHQMRPGVNLTTGGYAMVHPGLYAMLDFPDVASIACPKPMLFYNGLRDGLFSVESVEEAYGKMREVWHSQGVEDRIETRLWDVAHVFDAAMQEAAFAWLARML